MLVPMPWQQSVCLRQWLGTTIPIRSCRSHVYMTCGVPSPKWPNSQKTGGILHSKVASNCVSRTTPAKCKQLSAGSPCRCPRAWLLGWRLVVAFLTWPHTLIFLVSSFTCVPLYHSAVQAPNCPPPPPLHPLCCIIAVHHVGPITTNSFECQPAIGAQPPTIQSTIAW